MDEYKNNLKDYVTAKGMDDFFVKDDPFLETLAEKAAELKKNPSTSLKTDENIRDLTRLSLYQPVIYCGKQQQESEQN